MMVTFGQKIVAISSLIIFLWLCVGTLMYRRYLHSTDPEFPEALKAMPVEKEVLDCRTKTEKLSPGFWKRINLHRLELPESIKNSLPEINVVSHYITVQGAKMHYRSANPKENNGISVLLLHGQSFTSETWNKIDTIRMIAAFGFHVVAVDLPGYGESLNIPNLNKSKYLEDLISALDMKKPVLISPSMSGTYSIKYLIEHPEKLNGYVAVSPIGTNYLRHASCAVKEGSDIDLNLSGDCRMLMDYLKPNELKLNCIKVPTLVIWGEFDRGGNSAKLCLLPESQGDEIPKGSHPAYLSNPDLWHKLLFNFLHTLNETQMCKQNS